MDIRFAASRSPQADTLVYAVKTGGLELLLVSEPANIIYPESFVERCQRAAGAGCRDRPCSMTEMAKLGMGALLGVAQGSVRASRACW
jgi:leucyl aminopeptidase